jgi:D-alanyl-D-alanine carboxypeptidase/D-alanyl-D-alanine-endopeptidase (penicillin-binding protein 4)
MGPGAALQREARRWRAPGVECSAGPGEALPQQAGRSRSLSVNRCTTLASMRKRLQWHRACSLVVFAALGLLSGLALADDPTPAQPKTKEQLASRFAELIQKSGLGGNMGAVVVDAWSGARLYTLAPETPRNPASNMKLVTAATALVELGPEHRLRTTLAGAIGPDGRVPALVLRGEGDPSLAFEDMLAMAQRLVDYGVREVDEIVVDGSYFDGQILPPAYEQQPKEIAAFRAAVGAVSVDRNAYELRVAPGPAVNAPANVILRCPDHFALESAIKTSAAGAPSVIAEQKPRGEELGLRLTGVMPLGVRGAGYERRVESPLHYAGHCMKSALRSLRIAGELRVRIGTAAAPAPVLLTHESAPLSSLLQRVGKNSDNFYAEMLLKVIGAESGKQPGSSVAGIARTQNLLKSAGVPAGAAAMVNGSGLFKGGAVTPDALARLLVHMVNDPALRPEYLSQLAVAGVDGTLSGRLSDLKRTRVVRAKTGTLDDVVALSGYVFGPGESRALAFSFLVNGCAGKQSLARALVDDLVRAMVAHLWP